MFKNFSPSELGIKTNLREALRLATIGGFDGMDLPVDETIELVEKYSIDYVRGMYQSFNLKIGGWKLPVNIYSDEEEFKSGLEKLKKFVPIATELGAKRVYTAVRPFSDKKDYNENFKWHKERIKKIVDVIEDCHLGLEFISTPSLRKNHKYEFIHTLEELLQLISDLKNTGVLLDSWHWFISGGKIEDIENLDRRKIVYVHINDAPSTEIEVLNNDERNIPAETGIIDLVGFLKAFKKIGYDGPVTPDPFNKRVNEMPEEISVRLVGGYMSALWNRVF